MPADIVTCLSFDKFQRPYDCCTCLMKSRHPYRYLAWLEKLVLTVLGGLPCLGRDLGSVLFILIKIQSDRLKRITSDYVLRTQTFLDRLTVYNSTTLKCFDKI